MNKNLVNAAVLIGVPAEVFLLLLFMEKTDSYFVPLVAGIAVTEVILQGIHRRTPLFIGPCAWALAVIPTYIFSHSFARGGFLGSRFVFAVLAGMFLLPAFLISLVRSLINAGVRRRESKPEQTASDCPPEDGI